MKKRILAIAVAVMVCLVLGLTVLGAAPDYSVKIPKGITLEYATGNMNGVAKIIGMKPDELKQKCKEDNILFVGVNSDNTVQIKLLKYKTELSESVNDISGISDSMAEDLSEDIKKNGYEKTAVGSLVFLKVTENLTDTGGDYISEQYITVKNGYVYQLSFYISSEAKEGIVSEFLNGFKLNEQTVYSTKQKVIVASVIAVLATLVIIMIIGIIKDIKKGE